MFSDAKYVCVSVFTILTLSRNKIYVIFRYEKKHGIEKQLREGVAERDKDCSQLAQILDGKLQLTIMM